MPTYQYKCKACSADLEVVQSFSDKPLKKHQGCGGELRKVFAAPGISFKGGGFYKTDSRGSSGSSSSDSSGSSGSSGGDSSSSSSSGGGSSDSSSSSSSSSGDKAAASSTSSS